MRGRSQLFRWLATRGADGDVGAPEEGQRPAVREAYPIGVSRARRTDSAAASAATGKYAIPESTEGRSEHHESNESNES